MNAIALGVAKSEHVQTPKRLSKPPSACDIDWILESHSNHAGMLRVTLMHHEQRSMHPHTSDVPRLSRRRADANASRGRNAPTIV